MQSKDTPYVCSLRKRCIQQGQTTRRPGRRVGIFFLFTLTTFVSGKCQRRSPHPTVLRNTTQQMRSCVCGSVNASNNYKNGDEGTTRDTFVYRFEPSVNGAYNGSSGLYCSGAVQNMGVFSRFICEERNINHHTKNIFLNGLLWFVPIIFFFYSVTKQCEI